MTLSQRSVRTFIVLALLLMLLPLEVSARNQTSGTTLETSTTVTIDFPAGMTFATSINLPDEQTPERVELYYQAVTEDFLRLAVADIESAPWPDVAVNVDMQSDYIPSGIDLAYFWRVTTTAGSSLESQQETTSWTDTRFDWKTFETPSIQLHTYSLTDAFALSVADTAQSTVTELEQRYGMIQEHPISIWIYASATDFRPALQTNSREAVAGASYRGYYVVQAVLQDGDNREVGRTITHEVGHQVLYGATLNPYSGPPLWFDEGMATHAQTAGTESYLPLAISSAKSETLFELESLNIEFPFKPSEAAIAYALSWSSIEYIIETWGDQGISSLIDQFRTGVPVLDAIQSALGISMEQLDADLRVWLLGHD